MPEQPKTLTPIETRAARAAAKDAARAMSREEIREAGGFQAAQTMHFRLIAGDDVKLAAAVKEELAGRPGARFR